MTQGTTPASLAMQGFIYVVGFESGVVKVGRTRSPKRRISAYRKDGAVHGNAVTATWVSPPHLRSRDNEANLIRFCTKQGAHIGARRRGEYFTGFHFEDVRAYAESLDFTHSDPDRWDLMAANGGSLPSEGNPMTATPKPLTEDSRITLDNCAPIGTRYTDGDETYTLVAYAVDPLNRTANPRFIADDDLAKGPNTGQYSLIQDGSIALLEVPDVVGIGCETLHPAEPDTVKADAARAALAARKEPAFRDTSHFTYVMLCADLVSEDERRGFVSYAKAELELRKAQWALDRASRERSASIARMVDLKGSQSAAAQTLGLNQSTVSRALRERA